MDIYYRTRIGMHTMIYVVLRENTIWISCEGDYGWSNGTLEFRTSALSLDDTYKKLSKARFLFNYLDKLIKTNNFCEQRKITINNILKGLL